MAAPFDFKKQDKALYSPSVEPELIDVPELLFIQVDGCGNPNAPDDAYVAAISLLYSLSYTIRMNKSGDTVPAGYFDYVVPPLEGLWWFRDESTYDPAKKDELCWTAMIRQPEFVTPDLFTWAQAQVLRKKPDLDPGRAHLVRWREGLCIQALHLGPYDAEPATVARMVEHATTLGLHEELATVQPDGTRRRHHEIYLSDPGRVAPDKLKTIIRHPVAR